MHAGRASALLFQLAAASRADWPAKHSAAAPPCHSHAAISTSPQEILDYYLTITTPPIVCTLPCRHCCQAYPGSLHRAAVVTSRVCTTSPAKPATLVRLFLQPGQLWTTDDVGTARDTYDCTHHSNAAHAPSARQLDLLPLPRDILIDLGADTAIQNPQSPSPPRDSSRLSARIAPGPLQHAMSPPRMHPPCKPQATTSGCNNTSSISNTST